MTTKITKVIPHAELGAACEQGWELVELLHVEVVAELAEWTPNPSYQVIVQGRDSYNRAREYTPPSIDDLKQYAVTDNDGRPSHLMTRRTAIQKTVMCLVRRNADGALAKQVKVSEDLRSQLAGAQANARTLKEERDKLTEALNKGLAEAKDEVTRIFADEGRLLRGTINDLRRDLEGSQLALKNCDAARAAFAAELAQLKGKMAADKKVMDELSDAAARGRNLEVT